MHDFNYTAHKSDEIDRTIENHMAIVVNEILKSMHSVDSILLSGGFGRGEGSVYKFGTTYVPMNDYDLFVFSDSIPSKSIYRSMVNRISNKIGVETQDSFFDVDIQIIKTSNIKKLNPDLSTYGLKYKSKKIWGKDLRALISIEKNDVPFNSVALNVLFLSTLGLIQNFDYEYMNKYSVKCAARFNYECYKVYIAISTSLFMLKKVLELRHLKRSEILLKTYGDWFPELAQVIPDLAERVFHYTNLKLMSLDFNEEKDSVLLWFRARRDLMIVMQYIISKLINKEFYSLIDMTKLVSENLRSISFFYFEPYICYMLRKKSLPASSSSIRTTMVAVSLILNLMYARDWRMYQEKTLVRAFFSTIPPIIRTYATSALLLNAIDTEGKVDMQAVGQASKILRIIYPHQYHNIPPVCAWTGLKNLCLLSYSIPSRIQKTAF
ncbi:MAG: hypothetical protein NWE93_06060 [Candidatus Bathyarchaeota archaeon]|nr:hypothetical protein [Candidatus Bathyarchaeota archaeon]